MMEVPDLQFIIGKLYIENVELQHGVEHLQAALSDLTNRYNQLIGHGVQDEEVNVKK